MLRKRMLLAPVALAAAATFSSSAFALEFHGYLRAGTGATSGGGSQTCFQLPGAYSKYRLGNECENYGEVAFDHNVYDGKDGVKFEYHVMFGYASNNDFQQDFEDLTEDKTSSDDNHWALRQNWIEAKNLPFLAGGSAWIGKRYYKRNDVHITDFFYRDVSGYGGGIEGIAFGPGKFSYALFRNSSSDDQAMTRHDFRYEGIPFFGFGSLEVGLNLNSGDGRDGATAEDGTGIHVEHFMPILGGFNKLAIQYGDGSLSNLAHAYPDYGQDDRKSWRIVEQLQWQVSPAFSGMATFVWQDQEDNYEWMSLGVRPVWHVSDYFKVQFEYGRDQVKPKSGDSNNRRTRTLDKFTLAPTLVAGRGFWARPELRLFVTHAKWNDAARDLWGGIAGGRLGSDTSATSYGIQAEAWW